MRDYVLTMSKILGHNLVDSVAFHLTCMRAFMSNQRDYLEFSIDKEVKVWTYYLSMSNILKRVLRNLVLWLIETLCLMGANGELGSNMQREV